MMNHDARHSLMRCTLNALEEELDHSRALCGAMEIVAAVAASGLMILPAEPTHAMLAAGAAAGGISEDAVRAVLYAVQAAAE